MHRKPLTLKPLPTVHRQKTPTLHHLRKLLPSSLRRGAVPPVQHGERHDPLDVPATSSRNHNLPRSAQGTAEVENVSIHTLVSFISPVETHINATHHPVAFHCQTPPTRIKVHSRRLCIAAYCRCSPCAGSTAQCCGGCSQQRRWLYM